MEKKKKFKHSWWEHLIFKYKVEKGRTRYLEYSRFRYLPFAIITLLIIVFSPIIIVFILIKGGWFKHVNFDPSQWTVCNEHGD